MTYSVVVLLRDGREVRAFWHDREHAAADYAQLALALTKEALYLQSVHKTRGFVVRGEDVLAIIVECPA